MYLSQNRGDFKHVNNLPAQIHIAEREGELPQQNKPVMAASQIGAECLVCLHHGHVNNGE